MLCSYAMFDNALIDSAENIYKRISSSPKLADNKTYAFPVHPGSPRKTCRRICSKSPDLHVNEGNQSLKCIVNC